MASSDSKPRPLLPRAELRVLRGLAHGSSLREIAAREHYSYHYARELKAMACARLGAKTTVQAVHLATLRGLIR